MAQAPIRSKFLEGFELAPITKASGIRGTSDRVERARESVLKAITEQGKYLQGDIDERPYEPRSGTTRTGRTRKRMTWYFQADDECWYTEVRYGVNRIDLGNGNMAIKAGKQLQSLKPIYDALTKAVKNGDFDDAFVTVAKRRGGGRKSQDAAPEPVAPARRKHATR